jgi:hypothetical protein
VHSNQKPETLRKSLDLAAIPEMAESPQIYKNFKLNLQIIGYQKFSNLMQKSAGQGIWKKYIYFQKCVRTLDGDLNQSKLMFNIED